MVLAYLCATTANLKSGSGVPVLINGSSRGNGPSKILGTCPIPCRLKSARLEVQDSSADLLETASAPSLQLAVDMLSDLADGVQDVANGYDEAVERFANGSVADQDGPAQPASLVAKSNLLFSMSHHCFVSNEKRD